MTPKDQDNADTPQVRYLLRRADGTAIEMDEEPTGGHDANDRLRLMKTTQDAVHSGKMKLVWQDENCETENFDDDARAYMMDGFDTDFYTALFTSSKIFKLPMVNGDISGARGIIYQLAVLWITEQRKKRLQFGKYGGMWSCGQFSGVWTDFLLQIKCREGFIAPHYYIGVRITTELDGGTVDRMFGWKPTFKISRLDFFPTAPEHGLTTVIFPNYGRPFCSEIEKKIIADEREAEMARKKEAKRIREEAVRHAERLKAMMMIAEAEERRQQREMEAMEASLDETIIAYNAQVKRVKDLITFNRENVAVPLTKRIEAKEAERQREEAERRHTEKIKQKEMERLAKHAPAFKTKSK